MPVWPSVCSRLPYSFRFALFGAMIALPPSRRITQPATVALTQALSTSPCCWPYSKVNPWKTTSRTWSAWMKGLSHRESTSVLNQG